jgi:phosphoglycerate dehydrogenase-like enzyme
VKAAIASLLILLGNYQFATHRQYTLDRESNMARTLVISQHQECFRERLDVEPLPDLDAHYCETAAQAQDHCAGVEIIFGAPDQVLPLLALCPNLKWVQSTWAGVTPLLNSSHRGYQLTGVKGVFGPPMSEYVLGWILALERNILQRAKATQWDSAAEYGLQGKTVGIMGTGSIGVHVAGSCRRFGMNTRGLNSNGRVVDNFDETFAGAERLAFAQNLDYLVALLPDTRATDNQVDAELLARLKPGATFINAGRGNCLVEQALLDAMDKRQISHAVLDVFREEPLPAAHPFWSIANVHITSHTSAPTRDFEIVKIFCENYRRYKAGEELLYPVNFERGY